jgi:hypothetical protein
MVEVVEGYECVVEVVEGYECVVEVVERYECVVEIVEVGWRWVAAAFGPASALASTPVYYNSMSLIYSFMI